MGKPLGPDHASLGKRAKSFLVGRLASFQIIVPPDNARAMLLIETTHLWNDYLAAERVRVRQESLAALERFTDAALKHSIEVWQPWALDLARRVVDDHEDIPVRLPLFRLMLFPALRDGLAKSIPGSARWLAGFGQLLYKSPSCRDQLPENQRSEHGLLLRAVQDDPGDTRAKNRLRLLMRSRFDYVLHELPCGVLYGNDGATIEQCDELMEELGDYEQLLEELGSEDTDRYLIAEARFHIPAYKHYLSERQHYTSYEDYLSTSGNS